LATGKEVWKAPKRIGGTTWGSLVHADGKLYALLRDGSTVIFKAGPEFEILAHNKLGRGERTNSSIAVSNGELFIRTSRHLWCIGK
jgi:hypothetical protein